MGTLGLVIVQVARIMSKNPQETDDAKILLYNTTQCELVAVSPERVPGIDFPSASLTLFSKTKQHTPPRAGMTLETLEEAGLFPAWLYKVDPITHQGMYALPSQPDAWIGMNDPMFTAWMRKRMEEVYMRAGDRPVPLTLGQR